MQAPPLLGPAALPTARNVDECVVTIDICIFLWMKYIGGNRLKSTSSLTPHEISVVIKGLPHLPKHVWVGRQYFTVYSMIAGECGYDILAEKGKKLKECDKTLG